ncbi:MAG: cytotoxic translational repressor of toxin-antitoxin stability system [Verrucomicrobiota bacterium]
MYQVTFSEQSLSELNKLDQLKQLELADVVGNLTPASLENPTEKIGVFNRDGKRLYRIRAGEYRVYFVVRSEDVIFCEVILPQHSLTDFIFRTKLPATEEDIIEQYSSFWSYLDRLRKGDKNASGK